MVEKKTRLITPPPPFFLLVRVEPNANGKQMWRRVGNIERSQGGNLGELAIYGGLILGLADTYT